MSFFSLDEKRAKAMNIHIEYMHARVGRMSRGGSASTVHDVTSTTSNSSRTIEQ